MGALEALALASCEETSGASGYEYYESAEVEVEAANPLCPGQLEFLDTNVRRIETELDAATDEPHRVVIERNLPVPGCREGAVGCYLGPDDGVHSLWLAVDHELVHAVAEPLGSPAVFWSEGLAEALRGTRTEMGTASVLAILDESGGGLDYATAGHFVRWLQESHGIEPLREVVAEGDFEQVYGMTIEEAAALFESEAPWSYPGHPSRCEHAPLQVDGVSVTLENIEIACDEHSSIRYLFSATDRTLVIDEPGTFELELSGGSPGFTAVYVMPCQEAELAEEPASDFIGDVRREDGSTPTFFETGMRHTVHLEPAKYWLTFGDSKHAQDPVRSTELTFELRRIGD